LLLLRQPRLLLAPLPRQQQLLQPHHLLRQPHLLLLPRCHLLLLLLLSQLLLPQQLLAEACPPLLAGLVALVMLVTCWHPVADPAACSKTAMQQAQHSTEQAATRASTVTTSAADLASATQIKES
jgi:hypothetical protein